MNSSRNWTLQVGQLRDTVMAMTTLNRIDIEQDAPALYRAYLKLDGAVAGAALPDALQDLVRIRASVINGCAYCVDMHTRDAQKRGEPLPRLFAVAAWHESPLFDDRERAAFALTDAVTKISEPAGLDAAYEEAAEHFDSAELAALLYTIVTINGWNRLAVTAHSVFAPEE
jgi:AhpD family alkylhydroperoxidase